MDRLPHLLWPEKYTGPEQKVEGVTTRSHRPSEIVVVPLQAAGKVKETPCVEPAGTMLSKREPARNGEREPKMEQNLNAWDDEKRN